MSEEEKAPVASQADSAQTASQDNAEGCESGNQMMSREVEEESDMQLSLDVHYTNEELQSRPFITPGSEIPENLLHLSHSFGYDSRRRGNLQILDDRTLIFIAGNLLILLDIPTHEQRYLRSCSGEGIGAIMVHPSRKYFAVAEKGNQPYIIVYEYPALQPYRILRGGTERAYSYVDFNRDGSLLASVGGAPDFMLILWDWRQEKVTLSCKAISQEVYRVSFSPYNPRLLTTAGSGHIKFWKMASTYTGLKLQGLIGYFGKTAATDVEGFVELPDGKVVSGSDWGNLLLWEGNSIKVEICRKGGQSCHAGVVQPFALEDGQLMTIGSDGAVRGWDLEGIDTADSNSDSSKYEMDPVNEMVVGHSVCLSFVVKSSQSDSFVWFAQDSNGAIWKLDLSFTHTTPDPECLFSFHAGPIQGLDVSKKSHLMATTAPDRSVKVFDFLAKRVLTTSHFNQGGTAVCWAPPLVNQTGGLLVTGFEDGVVRLLELFDPWKLHLLTRRSSKRDAELRLKQAFKPHNGHVTAVAYERNGEILATGSSDSTVFFFTVGDKYNPIGFVCVPGPVQALEWSPHTHKENRLLVLCQSGHVVEVQPPDPESQRPSKTFQLSELPRRSFRFWSIKSRIKREQEIARREVEKEKKRKEREERLKDSKQLEAELEEEEEEEEEELPSIHIPDPPSPLYCGFYSEPGQFWLSMGGYDSGFLYHCKFSEEQDQDPDERQDEPFAFLPIPNTDDDPIHTITFSSNRQLLFCGMHSGSIRIYPLKPGDLGLTSMQAFWALSVHDNQYGHLRHVRCSYDSLFVLTAGDDGNVFSFSLLPPEELEKGLQRRMAKVPSPRVGVENEAIVQDIEDPAAYSIETAKQKLDKDRLHQEAKLKIAAKQKKLAELRKKFKQAQSINLSMSEHSWLTFEELQLDRRFAELAERLKAQKLREVRQQMAWEEERYSIALRKRQDWFRNSLEANVVTVLALRTDHRLSTYRLLVLTETRPRLQSRSSWADRDEVVAPEHRKPKPEPEEEMSKPEEKEVLRPLVARSTRIKLADRQVERLQKAAEKAQQARAKIEKRKQEWAQLYTEKPDENWEDPQEVQAIREAQENLGDLKLKSDKNFTVPKHLRTTTERKRAQLIGLEAKIREKQKEMNEVILVLRDAEARLLSDLHAQVQQLHKVQQRLPERLRRPPPAWPKALPGEMTGKRLQCSQATLQRYRALMEQSAGKVEEEDEESKTASVLEQLEKEMEEGQEEKEMEGDEDDGPRSLSPSSVTREEEDVGADEEELNELMREEEIRLLYQQDTLLEQMESSVSQFDSMLQLLRMWKLRLDVELKLADLHQLTLYQELLLLKEFERREESLQDKLNGRIKEENGTTSKLQELTEELELRQGEVAKLQEREKALFAAFQVTLGEQNSFEEFLTKVFKKKVKRAKKEQTKDQGDEEGSEEDSCEDDDWDMDDDDDYSSGSDFEGISDNVCPQGCEPELFENTLQLRERRLDLDELLVMKKKSVEALKKECDSLVQRRKMMEISRKAVEDDLEMLHREKQKKMNEVDGVVPLRLNQIEFIAGGSVPSDLSTALVVNRAELHRLQERIKQLKVEKDLQRELCTKAKWQHVRIKSDIKEMENKIHELEAKCKQQMMFKYGRLVDLEALQMLAGNRREEELKQEKLLREAAHAEEIEQCDAEIEEARDKLIEVTKCDTELVLSMATLMNQKRELELCINPRQKKFNTHFQDNRRRLDQIEIRRLREVVKVQSQQIDAIKKDIFLLSRKGRYVLTPDQTLLPPIAPLSAPTGPIRTFRMVQDPLSRRATK